MMFQVFFSIVYWLIQTIQPILIPLCFVVAWSLVLLTALSLWTAVRDGVSNARRLHQIPCANCEFFTGDYHLKCTVRPSSALSEAAIGCTDYEPIISR